MFHSNFVCAANKFLHWIVYTNQARARFFFSDSFASCQTRSPFASVHAAYRSIYASFYFDDKKKMWETKINKTRGTNWINGRTFLFCACCFGSFFDDEVDRAWNRNSIELPTKIVYLIILCSSVLSQFEKRYYNVLFLNKTFNIL